MNGFIMRMILEREDLKEKINKINKVVNGGILPLNDEEIVMLKDQRDHMVKYRDSLTKRINYYTRNKKEA